MERKLMIKESFSVGTLLFGSVTQLFRGFDREFMSEKQVNNGVNYVFNGFPWLFPNKMIIKINDAYQPSKLLKSFLIAYFLILEFLTLPWTKNTRMVFAMNAWKKDTAMDNLKRRNSSFYFSSGWEG